MLHELRGQHSSQLACANSTEMVVSGTSSRWCLVSCVAHQERPGHWCNCVCATPVQASTVHHSQHNVHQQQYQCAILLLICIPVQGAALRVSPHSHLRPLQPESLTGRNILAAAHSRALHAGPRIPPHPVACACSPVPDQQPLLPGRAACREPAPPNTHTHLHRAVLR